MKLVQKHNSKRQQELYEPFWEDLYARSQSNGFRIRSVWIADIAQQGVSGVLNEQLLGNDRKQNSSNTVSSLIAS
jgi:hypothetical protein